MTSHNSYDTGFALGPNPAEQHDDHRETKGMGASQAHQSEPTNTLASSVTEPPDETSVFPSQTEMMHTDSRSAEGGEEETVFVQKVNVAAEELEQDSERQVDRAGDIYTTSTDTELPSGNFDTSGQATSIMTAPRTPDASPSVGSGSSKQQFSSLEKASWNQDTRHSLRRVLFTRNMESQVEPLPTLSEPTLAGSSSRERTQAPLASTVRIGKKSGTTITISPVIRFDEDPDLPFSQRRKGYGMISNLRRNSSRQQRNFFSIFSEKIKINYGKVHKVLNRISEIPPSANGRHIELNAAQQKPLKDERTGKAYMNNEIRSNKYSLWNFLPKQLIAQFSKLANFYFLCISILQLIPGLSTTGSYTTIVPLLFFVGISMAKEAYEDLRRHRLDKVDNNSMTDVLQSQSGSRDLEHDNEHSVSWKSTKWQDIQVGDIVKLQRNEAVPADVVMIHVEGASGIAYVETMALDGETNLKSKTALPILSNIGRSINNLVHCKAKIVVEDPNLDLYSFQGRATLDEETLPLTNNDILYRGSILRNTPEVIGMVVYSGQESKIRMNATKNPRIKAPALQAAVNRVVFMIVIFVLALAIWNTVAYQIWKSTTESKAFYLDDASVSFVTILVSFIILFNTYVCSINKCASEKLTRFQYDTLVFVCQS